MIKPIIIIFTSIIILSLSFLIIKPFNNHKISAVVIPHHDLVAEKRAKILKEVKNRTNPKIIILVSTNHFNAGNSNIITTDKVWNLLDSQLFPDYEIINNLSEKKLAVLDELPFQREHGIYNLLSPIHDNFPDAKVVPIIIKPGAEKDKLDKLSRELYDTCKNDCLLVSSVDFSHYQPGALAEIHDNFSLRSLFNIDKNLIWNTEVDSQETLYLTMNWAELNKTTNFHLEENTNSGKTENERDAESTSYIFGWYDNSNKTTVEDSLTFLIGGDMMFGRNIDAQFSQGRLIESVKNIGERFFWGTDVSLINLEGSISPVPTIPNTDPNNLIFNFPPMTVDVLKWLNINLVNLANNHSGNAGSKGMEYTKNILSENDISSVGIPRDIDDNSISRYEYGTEKLSIIAVNELEIGPDLSNIIRQEKNNGSYIIIYPHWGNEYEKIHSQKQQELAHLWIDNGADLVIGSHPHVVQDVEIYKNKPIFYSLGNLLFDQTFSEETQRGLVIAGELTKETIKLVLLPTISKNLKPELLRSQEKTEFIDKIRFQINMEISNKDYGYDIIVIKR